MPVSLAVLFPGQGSQHVGMGAELFDARPDLLGEAADEILGFPLRALCLEGPEEELTRTEHAQPALFAVSYALWDELRRAGLGAVAGAAGHSLGEYTALAAAGALGYEDALALVALRGRAMSEAADAAPSGMAALLGAEPGQAEAICERRRAEGGALQVANLNAPGQVVVAGGRDDIDWLTANVRELGIRRVVPLNVAGAFHSRFMEPARVRLAGALEEARFTPPLFPVWSNTTARPHRPAELAATLSRQLVEPVRFADCLLDMAASGITAFLHVGPGDVTAGLARRTVDGAEVLIVSGIGDIPSTLDSIGTMVDPR